MITPALSDIRERVMKKFPERQFIHRTGGQVNYFVLSPRAQIIMASIASIVALWCVFTVISVMWGQNPLRSSTKELRVQKEQFNRHLIDLDGQVLDARELLGAQQAEFELAAENFENKHNTIVAMITQGGIAQETDVLALNSYAASDVLMSPVVRDAVKRQPRSEFGSLEKLQTGTSLDQRLANVEDDQNDILVRGEAEMQDSIELNRAILASTGLNVDDILENGAGGVGGPLIELDDAQPLKPGSFMPRLNSIKARANEVDTLNKAVAAVPLAQPIDAENYLTSAYGRRKDPFTKRAMTMHSGMDIASYRLAPIVATAPGKVTFVGKNGGYGRTVVIDHGFGFKTRYAHLEKTFVKRGQMVEQGEKIAGMGSSGRSTSTHLHYEILFEKRSYDPAKFMKAGQYVQ